MPRLRPLNKLEIEARALSGIEMSPRRVLAPDEIPRVSPLPRRHHRLDASGLRGAISVATVEDLPLVEDDRVTGVVTVCPHAEHELVELGALHQRQQPRDRVVLVGALRVGDLERHAFS
jgi:hypothetical protein